MTATNASPAIREHVIERVRHELKMRLLQVRRTEHISPHMVRITLTGDDLAGFVSASYDDHVKVIFPLQGEEKPNIPAPGQPSLSLPPPDDDIRPVMRNYTPRRYDAASNELDIDFVLHGDGVASTWAEQACAGQYLGIAGPRGSFVIPTDFDWYLLVGDETALPAIGRRLEELPEGSRALVLIEIPDAGEQIALTSSAQLDIRWLHRDGAEAGSTNLLLEALRVLDLPQGDGYAWVATELGSVKAIRQHLIQERGVDKRYVRAASYWKHGASAHHESHDE